MYFNSHLANFAILPLISYFADFAGSNAFIWNSPELPIQGMLANDIAGSYVKYIGAGMMLSGGLIGAFKLIPTIYTAIKDTINSKSEDSAKSNSSIAMLALIGGVVIGFVAGFLISIGNIAMAIGGSILSLILSLLFVIVSGRLTGTIGTSNLPVSGMTIASLVIVTLVFVIMGWKGTADNKSLLLFSTFIVTAISIAGGYSQSQKVGFLIGGDKKEMDKYFLAASIVGVVVVVGVIHILADQIAMTSTDAKFALPQANLIFTLTSGIMSGDLPWHMIISGAVMGIVLLMLKLPVMTFAIGFYLPIATSSIILVGAILRVFIEKISSSKEDKEYRVSNGISLSSGLVAGGSIIGLLGIILQVLGVIGENQPTGFAAGNGMAYILLIVLVVAVFIPLLKKKRKTQA